MSDKERKDTNYQVVYTWNIKNYIFSPCSDFKSALTDDLPLIQHQKTKLVKFYKLRFVLQSNETGTYCSIEIEGLKNEKLDFACDCTLKASDAKTPYSSSFKFGSDCLLFTNEDRQSRREKFFSNDDLIIEFKIKRFFTEYDQLEIFKTMYSDYCEYFIQTLSVSTAVLVQTHSLSFKVRRLMDEAAVVCEVPSPIKCHLWMCSEFFMKFKISKIPYPYLKCNMYVCLSDGCKIFKRVDEFFKSDDTTLDEFCVLLNFEIQNVLKQDKDASIILEIRYRSGAIICEKTGYEVKQITLQEKSRAKLNPMRIEVQNGDLKSNEFVENRNELEFVRRFSHDVSLLHRSRKYSDVSVVCSDSVKFEAHGAILAARSEVWANTFGRKVHVPIVLELNFDSQTARDMLKYIYCVALPESRDLEKMMNLYKAGKEYKVHGLMEHCSSWLSTNLDVAGICDVLSLAESHKDENLKKIAMDFIMDHSVEVLKSMQWKDFLANSEPGLVSSVFCYLNERTLERCKGKD